jgi:hypothetical protein
MSPNKLILFVLLLLAPNVLAFHCKNIARKHRNPTRQFAEQSNFFDMWIKGVQRSSPSRKIPLNSAFKQVLSGEMGKRDFLMSRVYRLANKINPGTRCNSAEECLVEVSETKTNIFNMKISNLYVGSEMFLILFCSYFRTSF